jgi:hypothetical protein
MTRLAGKLKTLVFLILFSLFFLISCHKDSTSIALVWDEEKAVAISISKKLIGNATDINGIEVQLVKTEDRGPVLGEIKEDGSNILFTPTVPLTRGRDYEVFLRGKMIGTVSVPGSDARAPELIAIYPTQDTVPENLLKIYFKFSTSMVEGNSITNITLLRNSRDTVQGTFLDLSPELWNADGTMLTLWLDPGRIKRDLIPNKALGNPLEPSGVYSLHVSGRWRSKEDIEMGSGYIKNFTTIQRDEQMPVPDKWRLGIPASKTSEPLIVDLRESLDYSLLNDAITILDADRQEVKGTWVVGEEEKSISFIPGSNWNAGEYLVQVATRLEDLAGNNINRPFDRDIKKGKAPEERQFVERTLVIR